MVEAVRGGQSLRSVAARHGVSRTTVARWVARAGDGDPRAADLADRPSSPHRQPRRTAPWLEDEILEVRERLREESVLGEYGAAAIRRELDQRARPGAPVPSERTINRVLSRRGAIDRGRVRRPGPPRGWYLPDLAARAVELDSLDVTDGFRIRGGVRVEVLTAISLHGGLVDVWPGTGVRRDGVLAALEERWRAHGLPAYWQVDNDTRFAGSHGYADLVSVAVRFCLSLGVTPVFAPVREPGFQAAIESLNGRWQAKVWRRFDFPSLDELELRTAAWVAATRVRSAARIAAAPGRAPFPADWAFDRRELRPGRVVFLRRTDGVGSAAVLGRVYPVDPAWHHQLVRADLDVGAGTLTFRALRRRDPTDQPVLRTHPWLMAPARIRRARR